MSEVLNNAGFINVCFRKPNESENSDFCGDHSDDRRVLKLLERKEVTPYESGNL